MSAVDDGNNTILVVDDTPANLEIVMELLSSAGYTVWTATSGQRALKLLQSNRPALILLDIQMPHMDGFETCQHIKNNGETAHIPIIFLTVFSETEKITTGFSLGAVDYITKPFQEVELLARVRTHLQLYHLTHNLEQQVLERTTKVKDLESRQRKLFEASPIGLTLCRLDGSLVDVNAAYAAIIGRTMPETLTLSCWDITPEIYADDDRSQLKSLEKTGRYGPYEKEYIHRNGHLVPVRLSGILVEQDGEQFIWSCVEDISDRKRIETEREQLFQEVFKLNTDLKQVNQNLSDYSQTLEQRVNERTVALQESEQRLQNLVAGTAAATGKDFFPALARHISQALDMAYVIVSELKNNQLCTLVFWANGSLQSPLCYQPIKTPCERTLAEGEYCCFQSVQQQFPDDPDLVDMQAESYYGIALSNAQGQIIGELCLLHTQPLTDSKRLQIQQILRVFGARATAELERQRAQTALEELNHVLEAKVAERTVLIQRHLHTIETSIDGMSILHGGQYVFLNQSQLALFGYHQPDDVLGKPWQFLYQAEEIKRLEQIVFPHVKQQGYWRGETLGKRQDGTSIPIEISLTLTPDGDIIQVCRDISERQQYEIERQQAAEQIQQSLTQLAVSNQELEAFAYSISHDLRAPLRAINGFSQALREDYGGQFNKEAKYYFDRIRANTNRMGDLIDDLLGLAQVSRYQLNYTTVDLSALAQDILHDLQASDPERQVEISIAPKITTSADSALMQVVMMNLLQNAWKFTSNHPTAHIEFGVLPAESQGASETVYFVKDDGAGFDMAY
ncbi:MAG: response regulator, partial [Leptolyngbyaceae cyanobacterium MAG.088]|nr:response regulator [Leptolyngbyaceae cyanobacterium MAG.088]